MRAGGAVGGHGAVEEPALGWGAEGQAPHVEEEGGGFGEDLLHDGGVGVGGDERVGGGSGLLRVVEDALEQLDGGRGAEGVAGPADFAGRVDVQESFELCQDLSPLFPRPACVVV